MTQDADPDRWARLRFAIIGPLLAAPPARGEVGKALQQLAQQSWRHPVTGLPVRFSVATLERWYYLARRSRDPVAALRRRRRGDAGRGRRLSSAVIQALQAQYRQWPCWTMQLHYDNLVALAREEPALGPLPSYATVRRYMKAQGLTRKRLPKRQTAGAKRAEQRLEQREVRSYEADHVLGLWHLDFHHGSRKVLTPAGQWVRPVLLGILDDHSRVVCHGQWYYDETAETLVHGFCQALQRRGLPRALMTDNGAAMQAEEFRAGLHTLGILHQPTLPYSPYQNAKQETFWATIEGRLMAMLADLPDLTLARLNTITQAWVEQEYHRAHHTEIGSSPLRRYLDGNSVGRDCPGSDALRRAFRCTLTRRQRRSDGTLSLAGKRFEVPARYRHLAQVPIRYARWDLSRVELIDPHTRNNLCRLYPLDKSANADGRRRRLTTRSEATEPAPAEIPPLLRTLLSDYAATGRPPAYLPKHDDQDPDP
jgi:transposase InsO family protein